MISFFVPGKPQTAGSKTAFVNKKTGKAIVTESGTKDSKAAKRTWRGDLRDAAEQARPEGWDLTGPMEVWFTFVRKRPATHARTGKHEGMLKDWATDLLPVGQPDALKLARAAEDALTGILWQDDAQIVDEHLRKRFFDQVEVEHIEGVIVKVRPKVRPMESARQAMLADVPDGEDSP